MAKLSTQLVLLSNAAKRDDCALIISAKLQGSAAEKAIGPLLSRKLCKAITKTGELPLWKRGSGDEPLSLVITPKGLAAIGVEARETPDAGSPSPRSKRRVGKTPSAKVQTAKSAKRPKSNRKAAQRPNSKIATVVDMLRKPTGATIDAIMSATGWQAHSVRGAISGAIKKKLGLKVTSEVRGDDRFYRIGD
jgi:hypothetical protein